MKKSYSVGFTLIELLVVISIISLLASVIVASTNTARAKGQDAAKVTQAKSVRSAMALYYSQTGTVPHNYDCSGGACVTTATRPTGVAHETTNPTSEESKAYRASMQELVDAGVLGGIPHSADGTYGYYDYGANSSLGAAFTTTLQVLTAPQTSNTCYPNLSGGSCGMPMHIMGGPFVQYCTIPNPDGSTCNYVIDASQPNIMLSADANCAIPCSGKNGQYCTCNPY